MDRALLANNILSSDLLIYMVSHQDEGIYQCIAKNSIEEKVTGARLVIGGNECLVLLLKTCLHKVGWSSMAGWLTFREI